MAGFFPGNASAQGSASVVDTFEKALCQFLQVTEVDILSSGTLCLSIAFEALKEISGRRRVIVPAYTCPLVAIAANSAGVELVLCDTRKNGFQFDDDDLERLLDKSIAAVVPTYIAGLPTDLDFEKRKARAHGAYVVEDAAQALGARMHGRPLGSEADISIFSLAVGKGLSLFDGGVISAKQDSVREKIREIAKRRVKKKPLLNLFRQMQILGLYFMYNPSGMRLVYGNPLRDALSRGDLLEAVGDKFDLEIPAYEFDESRKRMGAAAINRLPDFVKDNRERGLARVKALNSELSERFQLKVLSETEGAEGSWPFLILVADSQERRDRIMAALWGSGLGVTRLFIHELASYEYLRSIIPRVDTPNARSLASRSFSITNSHWLSDSDFEKIMAEIAAVFSAPLGSTAS